MPKTTAKKSAGQEFKEEFKTHADAAAKELKTAGKKIIKKLKKAKDKFDALEPQKKKKIIAGIIGATVVAAGIGAGIAAKKRKKN